MGKNRPVIQGDGRVTINHRSWSAGADAKESRRHDDASRRQVSDQVGKTTRRGGRNSVQGIHTCTQRYPRSVLQSG